LCSSGALTTGKEENIMTIEKTLKAVSEKLKDAMLTVFCLDK